MRRDRPWSAILVVLASVGLVIVGVGGRLAGQASPTPLPRETVMSSAGSSPTVVAIPSTSARSTPALTAVPAGYSLPELGHGGSVVDVLRRSGRTAGLWTQPLGPVPGGEVDLEFVCAGPGSLDVGLLQGGPSSETPCDGLVRAGELELPPRPAILYATSSGLASWHVVARLPGATPLPTPSSAIALDPDAPRPSSIGSFDEAIVVVRLGPVDAPATGLLVRGFGADGTTRDIATIPVSAFPANADLGLFDGRPVVSRNGYLVVPFEDGSTSPSELGAVFDLADPAATPTILGDSVRGFAWSPDGSLAAPASGGVDIWSPVTHALTHVSPPAQVSAVTPEYETDGVVWTIGNQLVAVRSAPGGARRGVLSLDGSFEPDVPTISYAPLGTDATGRAPGVSSEKAATAPEPRDRLAASSSWRTRTERILSAGPADFRRTPSPCHSGPRQATRSGSSMTTSAAPEAHIT